MKSIIQIGSKVIVLITLIFAYSFTNALSQEINLDVQTFPQTVMTGGELEFIISSENANGLFYLGMEVIYNEDVFEFTGVEPGDVMNPSPLGVGGELETNKVGVSVVRTSGTSNGAGDIMTLTFTAKETAVGGDYTFEFSALDTRDNSGATLLSNISTSVVDVTVSEILAIGWANLQWPGSGSIQVGEEFNVYGQVWIDGVTNAPNPAGVEAWVGYNTTNATETSDFENGWTWVDADFNSNVGNNAEYVKNLGAEIDAEGTYYYVTRFRYNDDDFVYGGFSGGPWDGETNVSGVLTVNEPIVDPDPEITFANLQFPGSETIEIGGSIDAFAQVEVSELSADEENAYEGLTVWIGYSEENTNPSTWTTWVEASYNGLGEFSLRPEYTATIGSEITEAGTYYFASRFQLEEEAFVFGGFNDDGGGFWDGETNVSGVLTVNEPIVDPDPEITFANLQFPGNETIEIGGSIDAFAQVEVSELSADEENAYEGLTVWIGYSEENTNPSTWTTWVEASYNGLGEFSLRPEYTATIGSEITEAGTYYFASRFQLEEEAYVFGGISDDGGGFWDGETNVSGVLTVNAAPLIVTVWPGDTNNDGTVDAIDALAIGSYFGATGPVRENASTDWEGQEVVAWEPVDATFADTDGTGLINQTDLLAVGLNFGETHGSGTLTENAFTYDLPAIELGQYLQVEINAPVNLQGLGFMLRIEGLEPTDATIIDLETGSWANEWASSNNLIEFVRTDDLALGAAFVHQGSTATVSGDDLASFNISASTVWPSGATLIIDRIVYVDDENAQVGFEEIDVQITVQGSGVNIPNTELPLETALRQNYPNPFNPTTNIVFDISEQSVVTLEVINILGQRVALLANNEDMAPGAYTRTFDANRLTSGVYLIRMTAGAQSFTKKIMLVK